MFSEVNNNKRERYFIQTQHSVLLNTHTHTTNFGDKLRMFNTKNGLLCVGEQFKTTPNYSYKVLTQHVCCV